MAGLCADTQTATEAYSLH